MDRLSSHIEDRSSPEQFRDFSSMMSECFGSKWSAEPNGSQHRSMQLDWARSDGTAVARAQMTPVRLTNYSKSPLKPRKYYACFQDQPVTYQQDGRSIYLQPEEIFISTSSACCRWIAHRDYDTSSLMFDAELFEQHLPHHADLVGYRLQVPKSIMATLKTLLDYAWLASREGIFDEAGPKLARSFLEVLSVAVLTQDRSGTGRMQRLLKAPEARRDQVKAYIQRNFSDPCLSISDIASALKLSPRYIQLAFAEEKTTPSDYIRKIRLEESARLLASHDRDGRSITDIAFGSGFNSSSYFATQFRRHFGVSPRAFRAQVQLSAGLR